MKQESVLLRILASGDLRSKGKTDAIIRQAQRSAALRTSLFALLDHPDRLVRMRASDILEKITVDRAELLQPHRQLMLKVMKKYEDKELRWHLIQLAGRTDWTLSQRREVIRLLRRWYREDGSNIVRVFSMQALFDFGVFPKAELRRAARSATFSIRARAKILLSHK